MPVSPPRPKGPPLNALRAFEASARLGGFAAAAAELCVTPGAVSQHVKMLEQWAGAELFERRSQGVAPTALGAELSGSFSAAFDNLGAAVRQLRAGANPSMITIATMPGIGQLWLSPRLPAIRAALPDHTVSITALEAAPNLYREPFDIALFPGIPSGVTGETIVDDEVIFPVCSQMIAKRLVQPADLLAETWLYDSTWQGDWQHWIDRALPALGRAKKGLQYSLYSIALAEAINSAGVLMGHRALVQPAIDRGDLVAPFELPVKTGNCLLLSTGTDATVSDAVNTVVSMLVAHRGED